MHSRSSVLIYRWTGTIGLCACLSVSGVAHADAITLYEEEIPALRTLISNDARAQGQFNKLLELADATLPHAPSPIRTVISEGRLKADPDKVRTQKAMKDMQKAEALAWAAIILNDHRYASQAKRYIVAWAENNLSDGNPINETRFEPLVRAYDLMRKRLSKIEQRMIEDWLRAKAHALMNNQRGQTGNWQSHRIKMIGLIAAAIDDPVLWETSQSLFRQHMGRSFDSSGMSADFARRDALHYHLYAVHPLLTFACISTRLNMPVLAYMAPNGASLAGAVDFIIPYAVGQKTHIEFANSKNRFDRTRAEAGESEFSIHPWDPKQSIPIFAEAGCISDKYRSYIEQIAPEIHGGYANWRMVLNRAAQTAHPKQ